jgi:flavorubredoxin
MTVTNQQSGTTLHELAPRIFRISTPIPPNPGLPAGFTFNQFLIAANEPLLFHTGPRPMFPLVLEAVKKVLPPETLRYVGFSHTEGDECGALDEWLAVAPNAVPLTGKIGAMIFADGASTRKTRALADGERLTLGDETVVWFDAPHVPHGWDCGFLGETRTRTLFCGDLFTQAGATPPAVTESELTGPSEAMRRAMDYFSHGPNTRSAIERLAEFEPQLLACMHGSSFRGDGRRELLSLASALTTP